MFEFGGRNRGQRILGGVLATTVILGGCSSKSSRPTTESTTITVTQKQPAGVIPLKKKGQATLLEVGDKITRTRVLTPNVNKEQTFMLRPDQADGTQDLCVIYSPSESREMAKALSLTPEQSAGLVLTAFKRRIGLAYVVFNKETDIIKAISDDVGLPNYIQDIFDYTEPGSSTGQGYSILVDPTGNTRTDVGVTFLPLAPPSGTGTVGYEAGFIED